MTFEGILPQRETLSGVWPAQLIDPQGNHLQILAKILLKCPEQGRTYAIACLDVSVVCVTARMTGKTAQIEARPAARAHGGIVN